jgi:ribosome-binding factor A
MPSPIRQRRVADRLLQETSQLLQEMNDPRLALVTVTRVNIDRELEYANVFVSAVGDEARRKEVMLVLNGAKGYVRREIARRVQLRRAPELIFHWDPSPEKAEHIAQLLDEIKPAGPAPETPFRAGPPEDSPDEAADASDDER